MSAIEILAVVGIIGFIIVRQLRGELVHGKRAVLLPAILTVIGFTDLHASKGAHLQAADIACIVVGCAGSALIGLAFGAITRLEERGGYLWAQLPTRGLWLWAAMVVWRAIAMGVAAGMHAHVAASSSTLLFSLGVNRLAQAAVIVPRAMAMGVPFAPEKDGSTFLAGLFNGGGARQPGVGTRNGDGNGTGNGYGARGGYDVRGGYGYDVRGGYGAGGANGGPVDLGREFGPEDVRDEDPREDRFGARGDRW